MGEVILNQTSDGKTNTFVIDICQANATCAFIYHHTDEHGDKWNTLQGFLADKQHVKNLSGGNQQKVAVGKWLAADCDVYIFDEPTKGVDVGAKQDIHALVHELANQGLAVIIISDDLPEVVVNSSRVIVMKEGSIVGEMTGDEITEANIAKIIA